MSDLSGEVELADGRVVTIPRPDEVFPKFAKIDASVDVVVEDGRIRMRAEDDCTLELGTANRGIDDPTPYATLYANMDGSDKREDELYSEVALSDAEAVRELRDALTLVLEYRGDDA